MYRIAIYGKGGIGKSTITCNISAALAQTGYSVMQIGCDPKSDSTRALCKGSSIPTVLDRMRDGAEVALEDVVFRAENGVLCVEAGGPIPGVGCAGRGIITAFDLLEELDAFETYQPDIIIYDVLGDVVCGGFAMPLRGEYSDAVAIVTSGEMMSLYAAGNIMHAIESFKARGYAAFKGLIANLRNIEDEQEKIDRFCREHGANVIERIPRSSYVQDAENAQGAVVELFPDSEIAQAYRRIAESIVEDAHGAQA